MFLLTLVLDELSQKYVGNGSGYVVEKGDSPVKMIDGKPYLDLNMVNGFKYGFQNRPELTFLARFTSKTTEKGQRRLAIEGNKQPEHRSAKADTIYIGNGVELFRDKEDVTNNPVGNAKANYRQNHSDLPPY